MEEVSISLTYEDLQYISDVVFCTPQETKDYVKNIKKVIENDGESYMFFSAGESTHFFTRGIINNAIITITVRKVDE